MMDNEIKLPDASRDVIDEVRPIVKIIGVGGGGCNLVERVCVKQPKGITFAICDTDKRVLSNPLVDKKLLIGGTSAGTSIDSDLARRVAEESRAEIASLFDDGTKMAFIVVGMGGDTGMGVAPVVARIAREKGVLAIGFVTIPFLFEGEKKILKVLDGTDEMSKYVDAMLLINNERLTDMYQECPIEQAFDYVAEYLAEAASGIVDIIIGVNSIIYLDFNDVRRVLTGGNFAVVAKGYGEGESRVSKAIADALRMASIFTKHGLENSEKSLFKIESSNASKITLKDTDELTAFMTEFSPDAEMTWGVGYDDTLGEKVRITVVAAFAEAPANQEKMDNEKTNTNNE